MVTFDIEEKVLPKVSINIGALLDVPTSVIITGAKGESIYNGGLGPITAIIGAGNNFKSTIMHYMMLSAANRVFETTPTQMISYDTEMNMSLERLEALADKFEHIPKYPIQGDMKAWTLTDKSLVAGNEWAVKINKYIEEKQKDKGSQSTFTPFRDPYTKKELHMPTPTFVEIDSLSEFEAKSSMDMLAKDLDSSETNTFAMKQGLFKSKFLSTVPGMSISSNTYFLITAQLGEKNEMKSGPAMFQQPFKNLQYLKQGEHIKGVSPKFFFLTHNAWYAHTAKLLVNSGTNLPEFPLDGSDSQRTDLNVVKLTQLRGKNGPSGFTLSLVVSQTEGVLPSLTEFYHIKENGKFGIDGNDRSYHLDLYPEVNLSRTTVRSKLNSDPLLRRAVNITSELLQIEMFQRQIADQGLLCSPKELYEDIKKLGYDWNILLNTRGYWTIDQYTNPVPFLSTIDLLRMRKGLYEPYFIKK